MSQVAVTEDVDRSSDFALDRWQELTAALRHYFLGRVAAADADDLTQECLLRIQRQWPAIRHRERWRSWAFKIARNLLIDHQRRHRLMPDRLAVDAATTLPSLEPSADFQIGGWLTAMIRRLPPMYAQVLLEAEIDALPYRIVAERHGLSASGVKTRVQRGRELLRELLLGACAFERGADGRVTACEPRPEQRCDCADPGAPSSERTD